VGLALPIAAAPVIVPLPPMRLAYLYSRYPVLSQTFCDTEMLELERRGWSLCLGSVHPPLTTLRHAHADQLQAPVHYAPPDAVLRLFEEKAKAEGRWPEDLIQAHERKYGSEFKAALRARNASYFAHLFTREGIDHFHVHFANRAAHTALFLRAMSGIPFSITAHGQDFMSDLGNLELLREICLAAEFIAVETDYSRGLLADLCPPAADKIRRVYNGMDLANFQEVFIPSFSQGAIRLLSVGRLVEFKGFTHLIAACADLRRRGLDFTCEIIGDGPLREELQRQITQEDLESVVTLAGSLPQETVFEKLRGCDVFVLASITDRAGASDVFPTVILEAMASARPVVSTEVAGIPEAVVHCRTGFLVPPADSISLANCLDRLIRDQWQRVEFGTAGRARVEEHFQIATTIEPLLELLADRVESAAEPSLASSENPNPSPVAYLIDRWPNPNLPLLEVELLEMQKRGVPFIAFVCRFDPAMPLSPAMEQLATQFVFLPDPMVIEAEWQRNRAFVRLLEDARANEKHRAASALFLEQARHAIALRPLFLRHQIAHLHATNSGALVCALMLQRLLGVTLSATIEPNPELQLRALRAGLGHCQGGRVSDPGLSAHLHNESFLLEPAGFSSLLPKFGVGLKRHGGIWQRWAELLAGWRSSNL